jgi:adenylate kinase
VRLLLIAPPGAGKGTQAVRISDYFGIPHISTGDLFRAHVAKGTELGLQVKEYLDRGDLVPDDVVTAMVREAIQEAMAVAGGYLLDGFPRNLSQAREGYRMAVDLDATVHAVLHFVVEEDELLRRLLGRGVTEGRSDDNETTVRHRLEVYHTQTEPLVEYYRERKILVTVDASHPIDEVTKESLAALETLRPAAGP